MSDDVKEFSLEIDIAKLPIPGHVPPEAFIEAVEELRSDDEAMRLYGLLKLQLSPAVSGYSDIVSDQPQRVDAMINACAAAASWLMTITLRRCFFQQEHIFLENFNQCLKKLTEHQAESYGNMIDHLVDEFSAVLEARTAKAAAKKAELNPSEH